MIKLYICREITPPLYGSLNAWIESYKREKNGYPTFCSAAAFFRLSCKLCTALSRYARMPTEKIQRFCRQREYGKNSDAENGFRLPATLNLSTACHDGVGLGGIKGEKERFVFERFFVGTERRKPFFALLLIYTAKRDKKTVYFTKSSQNTGSEKMPIII